MMMDPYENDLEPSMTLQNDDVIHADDVAPLTRSVSDSNSLLRTRMDMFEVSKTDQYLQKIGTYNTAS